MNVLKPASSFVSACARPQHFRDILELSKGVFNGRDYLPCIYGDWVRQSHHGRHRHNFVFQDDYGKVLGFHSYLVQKNGEFCLRQGGRIDKAVRGNGIFYEMSAYNEDILRKTYPDLVFYRSIYSGNTPAEYLKGSHLGKEVCRRGAIYIKVDQDKVALLKAEMKMKRKTLKKMSMAETIYQFKRGTFDFGLQNNIFRFDLHSIHRDNLHQLCDITPFAPNALVDDDNPLELPKSLSLSTSPYPCPAGLMGTIDIFTQDDDVEATKRHLDQQLSAITCDDLPCRGQVPILLSIQVDQRVTAEIKRYVVQEKGFGTLFNVTNRRKIEEEGEQFAITFQVQ